MKETETKHNHIYNEFHCACSFCACMDVVCRKKRKVEFICWSEGSEKEGNQIDVDVLIIISWRIEMMPGQKRVRTTRSFSSVSGNSILVYVTPSTFTTHATAQVVVIVVKII